MKPNLSSPPRLTHREARRLVRRSRRRGQALLLAVLLMVFAALLGATMITLVSSNLNQTTRQGGLSGARASSSAAIAFVNDRLTNSLDGDMWRPWMGNIPPLKSASAADFNAYYTPFEQAQGWINEVNFTALPNTDTNDYNGNGITYQQASNPATLDRREQESETVAYFDRQIQAGKRCYIKFPDPRGPVTNANGPQYLVQIAPTTEGALRVSVIGTNEGEPGAFDIRTAVKPTSRYQGPFSYARFDSNYSYDRKELTQTKLRTAITAATATLDVEDVVGLTPGRTIVISDDASQAQAAVVKSVAPGVITLSANIVLPPSGGYDIGTKVTAASSVMDGLTTDVFDADGDGVTATTDPTHTWETTTLPARYPNPPAALPTPIPGARSMFVNGGVLTAGKMLINLSTGDQFKVAGPLAAQPGVAAKQILVDDPSDATAPVAVTDNNNPKSPAQQRIIDNRDPQTRRVQPLTPPIIDGADSRYRERTQLADVSAGSPYGYGPGVYINNAADIERAAVGGSALTIDQSHQMYTNRAPYAYAAPVAGTLEQRRIRGWVSPWEFLPRGTHIDLQGDKIVFTLDDRSDAAGTSPLLNLPDPSKAWKGTGGAALAAPGASTYRMVLDVNTGRRTVGAPGAEVEVIPAGTTPFNGLIFLEGNARVRGFLKKGAVTGRDVTIVSMGSIFIEGSVVRDATSAATIANPTAAPRIALLAKRDVVLNLTQSLAHVSGAQDRDVPAALLAAAPTAGTNTVTVTPATVNSIRVGDIVRVTNDRLWHQVTAVNATGELTLSTNLGPGTTGAAGDPVRHLSDPALKTETNPDTNLPETFYDSAPPSVTAGAPSNGEAFARSIKLSGVDATSTYDLSWLHAGEKKEAISFERPTTAVTPGTFHTRNKALATPPVPPVPADVIRGLAAANEKRFFASGDTTTPPQPDVNDVDLLDLDSDGTRGNDTTETLTKLQGLFPPPTPILPPPGPQGPTWNVTIQPGLGDAPARRLAAIGATVGGPADPTVAPGSKYSIPLALSGGWYFQAGWNANTLSLLTPLGADPKPPVWRPVGASPLPDGDDDLESTREDFYQRNGAAATQVQAPLRWSQSPDLAVGAIISESENLVAFSQDIDPLPGVAPAAPVVPNYRIGMPKLEADKFAAAASNFNPVPIYVQATIFAQDGSWLVATPTLNAVPDINNSSIGGPFTADTADLSAATRYRRWNYRVEVKGSIVQNFTPSGTIDFDTAGTPIKGAMLTWLDTLAYPTKIESNGGTPARGRGRDWQTIEYQPDPVPFYNGLYLPPTPDLLYTS